MSSWLMEGPYLKACNCDPGCPCDFNQAPTHGHCQAIAGMNITRGHFGDVDLTGATWLSILKWPGRMDEGNGHVQGVLDCTDEQVEALGTILSGAPGGTFFQIVDMVCPHKHDPVRAPIDFHVDLESRVATVSVPDVLEVVTDSLRGIDPPDPYRIQIHIPNGFEYVNDDMSADVALATTVRSRAEVTMDVENGHASLCNVRFEGEVPVPA